MTGWEAPASLESGPGPRVPCNLPPPDREGGVTGEKMRYMTGEMKLSFKCQIKQKEGRRNIERQTWKWRQKRNLWPLFLRRIKSGESEHHSLIKRMVPYIFCEFDTVGFLETIQIFRSSILFQCPQRFLIRLENWLVQQINKTSLAKLLIV